MERLEFIAEAKKRDYSDSEIQELLKSYDKSVHDGEPSMHELLFEFFNECQIEVHTTCAMA